MRSFAAARVAVTAAWLLARAALAAGQAAAPPPRPSPSSSRPDTAPSAQSAPATRPSSRLSRWLDPQQASLNLRYREQETSEGVVGFNQIQHQEQFRFRVKLDRAARYSVHLGAFSGQGFGIGWNNTGIGTGDATPYFALKQLFVAAEPIAGVEAQVGSLYLWRGESTEITGYDNDGFITGLRVSVRRPAQLFFNEITYTQANLEASAPPFVFRRFDRFDDVNYRQFGVTRTFGRLVASSFDVTTHNGVETLRAGGRLRIAGGRATDGRATDGRATGMVVRGAMRAIDGVRVEVYRRVNGPNPASGFAATADKALFKNAIALSGGLSVIDRHYTLSGDRFGPGNHLFLLAAAPLSREWTLQVFAANAINTDYALTNGTRVDVVIQYNLLQSLRRLKLLP
jgi:hypothetical protein